MKAIRNFAGLIAVAVVFLAALLAGVAGNLRSGNYIVIPILFTAFLLFIGAIWFSRYKVRVMLRDPAPDRIISHYHQSLRRIPDAKASSAFLSALAAAFFGDFEKARREFEDVPDEGRRAYVKSTLALLEQNNYEEAIRQADQGKITESAPVLDEVIRVVSGENSGSERLERIARKQHGLMPAMAAWALAVHYKRVGKDDKAVEFKAILKDAIPGALVLKQLSAETVSYRRLVVTSTDRTSPLRMSTEQENRKDSEP